MDLVSQLGQTFMGIHKSVYDVYLLEPVVSTLK